MEYIKELIEKKDIDGLLREKEVIEKIIISYNELVTELLNDEKENKYKYEKMKIEKNLKNEIEKNREIKNALITLYEEKEEKKNNKK